MQLAGGGCTLWAVGNAVNHQRASSANTFAAVVVEDNRFFVVGDEALVQHVEQLEERCLVADFVDVVCLEVARVGWAALAPHLEGEIFEVAHL